MRQCPDTGCRRTGAIGPTGWKSRDDTVRAAKRGNHITGGVHVTCRLPTSTDIPHWHTIEHLDITAAGRPSGAVR
eukprot:1899864-Pyramimonas_sp.AAC.1